MPEKSVDSKKSVDSGFLKESKQEGSPIGQNVEKAQFQKKNTVKNASKKKKNGVRKEPANASKWQPILTPPLERIFDHSTPRLVS